MSYKIFFFIFILSLIPITEIKAQKKSKKDFTRNFMYAKELGIDTNITFTYKDIVGKKFTNTGGFGGESINFFSTDSAEIQKTNCLSHTTYFCKYRFKETNSVLVEEKPYFTQYDIIKIKDYVCLVPAHIPDMFIDFYKEVERDFKKGVKRAMKKNKSQQNHKLANNQMDYKKLSAVALMELDD